MPIYILSVLYLLFCFWIFLTTKKYYLGIYHFYLLLGVVPYVIRPILSYVYDYRIYISNYYDGNDYFQIYILVLSFNVIFSIGYFVKSKTLKTYKNTIKFFYIPYKKTIFLSISVIIFLFMYMFIVAGINWLGPFRDTVASKVIPEFRFFYPIIVYISYFIIICLFFMRFNNIISKINMFCIMLFIFIVFVLLNTRGWFIQILFLYLSFLCNYKKTSFKSIFLNIVIVVFVVFFMRNIISVIFQNEIIKDYSNENFLLSKLLYTSSGDIIDTWYVVLDFVKDYGQHFTFINDFLLLLPENIRANYDVKAAVDLLNIYYHGNKYHIDNFGFNINIFQELYINFSYFGLFFAFILGYLYRYFEEKIFVIKYVAFICILKILVYVQILNCLTSFAFLPWLMFFIIFSICFYFLRYIFICRN